MSDARTNEPLRLFQGFGVELEYMIVRREDLSILPVSDLVLKELAGEIRNEVEVESISWSNELVMHVIELKNTDPVPALAPLSETFSDHILRMSARLEPMGAMLLPGAVHPFMRPREETKLWPHDAREIYQAFDRIFDCRRHGWANLQSVQLNLSFGDDDEFGRLHAAIRLVLPVLASLAASSPVVEGELTGLMDTRLEAYRTNAERLPCVVGAIVPEPVFTKRDYERVIYEPMYQDVEPLDPEGTLRHPWLNARGAIAQFARDAIEIRTLDMQETPFADIAICAAATAVTKALVEERWSDYRRQQAWDSQPLSNILRDTIRDAEKTVLANRDYLEMFGYPDRDGTAQELWLYLVETLAPEFPDLSSPHLRIILNKGPLARRMVKALGRRPRREDIETVFRALAGALRSGESFIEP